MKHREKFFKYTYVTGIIALAIGILDPLEGSVVIAFGSILLAVSTWLTHDRFRKLFLICSLMILTGVFFLFYLSSLGGFGGTSELSWWWGTLILPYPAGWIMTIVTIILRAQKRKELSNVQ